MTGIGENTLAQPVKPPLRERRAYLAKLVKNRLTLTDGTHTGEISCDSIALAILAASLRSFLDERLLALI